MRASTSSVWPWIIACLPAQSIQLPYSNNYTDVNLGSVPGVPPNYGGVAFRALEPNTLYITGGANSAAGALYKIGVSRDTSKHVTGFVGTAVQVATAAHNDGGLQFGPSDVAFYTRYPNHELGQVKLGSTATNKVTSLAALSLNGSVGALSFVPAGYPGSGKLKLASYDTNDFYTCSLTPDGSGTYNVGAVTKGTTIRGGVEGFLYVPPGSPQFVDFNVMLVCEYGSGGVFAYDLDANADPIPYSRRPFMTGLIGAQSAAIDPLSGDFVFSTYGGNGTIVAVRGFSLPCGAIVSYGAGTRGTGNLAPTLTSQGCFARGRAVSLEVGNGCGGAPGVLMMGLSPQLYVFPGLTLHVQPTATVNHTLAGTPGMAGAGTWSLPLTIPNNTFLLNTSFYFQGMYLDPNGPFGVSATAGLKLQVR